MLLVLGTAQLRLLQSGLHAVIADHAIVANLGGDILEVQELLIVLDVFEQALTDKHFQLVCMIGVGARTRTKLALRIGQLTDLLAVLLQLMLITPLRLDKPARIVNDQQ